MLRCLTSLIFSNKPVSGCVISPPSTAQPACFQWKINDSHCWFCLFFLVHWNSFNRQLLCGPAPFILCKPSPTLAPYQGHTLQFSSSCWTALKFASVEPRPRPPELTHLLTFKPWGLRSNPSLESIGDFDSSDGPWNVFPSFPWKDPVNRDSGPCPKTFEFVFPPRQS